MVAGYTDAVAALRASATTARPVALLCTQAVLGGLGPEGTAAMIEAAQADVPRLNPVQWIGDCGSDAGLALAAIRAGIPFLVVHLDEPARARLADIARQAGVTILDQPPGATAGISAGPAAPGVPESAALPMPGG